METLEIRFQGKLATSGKMHFYEYGRYQYATARFLSTLEHFRRTGKVANKITGSAKLDIYISAPEKGSFVETIVIPKLIETASVAISIPLNTLISYVWGILLPRSENTENDLIKIAEIELKRDGERTAQSKELRKIVESQAATTQQALGLVKIAMESNNPQLSDEGLMGQRLIDMEKELRTESERSKLIEKDRNILENIDSEQLMKLVSRTSTIAPEMAVPMRKSAEFADFSVKGSSSPFFRLDESTAKRISAKKLDSEIKEIEGRVRSYDVDRGVGKFVSPNMDRQLNFYVAPQLQKLWLDSILNAMRQDKSILTYQTFMDLGNQPSSLVFLGIDNSP